MLSFSSDVDVVKFEPGVFGSTALSRARSLPPPAWTLPPPRSPPDM
jgi:hypothetical protein